MDIRRLAAFLMGAWLLGSCAMFFVATRNFQGVTRLIEAPSRDASSRITQLGQGDARLLLRYQVSELNRFYFAIWERAQLILGTALFLVLTRKPRRKRFLITALLMLAIVAATHWLLSPEITRIGRLMDFVDGARQTADGQTFWRLHQTYATLEVLKFLLGGYLTFLLFTAPAAAPSPSDGTGREVNFINDRKHSGVDG